MFTHLRTCSALDYTRAPMFAVAWMTDVLDITVEKYRKLGRDYLGSERAPIAEATWNRRCRRRWRTEIDQVVDGLSVTRSGRGSCTGTSERWGRYSTSAHG